MRKSVFFKNTSILIISNIISGILTFIFSIILSREIGSRGMGLYQLVMPLYSILIFVTSGGISITMSRIAAEKKTEGNIRELYRTVKVICLLEVVWSIFIVGLIAAAVNFISVNLLGDSRTYYSILAFCPALIMISLSSTFRGTYYGVQKVFAPAIIDIAEKIVKILVMFPLVTLTKHMSLELASAAAVLSLSAGEVMSFILFFISFRFYLKNYPPRGISDNNLQLVFNVMRMAFPISIESIATAVFGTITAVLIPKRLQAAGMNYEEALSLLGKLQGMVMNIALFPMIITSAFNVLLIPSIVESLAQRKIRILNHRINSAVGLALITSFLAAAVIFPDPVKISNYFYKDETVGRILGFISPVLPIIYVEYNSYAIINGLGEQTKLLVNSIIIQTIDIILLYIFVGIPKFNIYGYTVSVSLSAAIGILLNYNLIIKITGFKVEWARVVIIPVLCGLFTYLINLNFLSGWMNAPFMIITSVLVYCATYLPCSMYLKRN